MNPHRHRLFLYATAFVLATAMPYLTGFLGLMPLDQSIIFEAGGRIANGEIPFTDFYLPYGLVPSLLQALFFKLLGVNWFAYVTQAAIVNGLFTLVMLDCLSLLLPEVKPQKLVASSLLAAWAFYPMTGTPFLENHSLFFALLAYWSVLAGLRRKNYYLLSACFPLIVAGFYSKPIPVIFWLLPIIFECIQHAASYRKFLLPLLSGLLFACFLFLLPALIFPARNVFYYTIYLPFYLGKGRIESSFLHRIWRATTYFKLFWISVIPMLLWLISAIKSEMHNIRHLTRALLLISVSLMFGVLTKNAFYNVTTPVFIFTFILFHFQLLQSSTSGKLAAIYRRWNFMLWLVLIGGISLLNFRRTIDIRFGFSDLSHYSTQLGFFVKTPLDRYSKADIEKLKRLIETKEVLYTGDMQFLFSLSGRYNPLPLTHINDRTTYSSSDNIRYQQLKQQLLNNLIRSNTKWMIDDESIYNPDQQLVRDLDMMKGKQVDSFAGMKVYLVDSTKMSQLANSLKTTLDK